MSYTELRGTSPIISFRSIGIVSGIDLRQPPSLIFERFVLGRFVDAAQKILSIQISYGLKMKLSLILPEMAEAAFYSRYSVTTINQKPRTVCVLKSPNECRLDAVPGGSVVVRMLLVPQSGKRVCCKLF